MCIRDRVGTAMNSAAGKTTISDCTATVNQALSGGRDVTDSITPHGDFYNDVTTNNAGTVDIPVSYTHLFLNSL